MQFSYGDVSIRYEESGSGFPLLLLAPGALNSTVEAWDRAPINPLECYTDDFRLIAMDQRNAGKSTGPFAVSDPWGSYVEDQLRLLDHLGIEKAHLLGCCIGCSYALKMAEMAPGRIASAVLEQPIGMTEENRQHWLESRRRWSDRLVESRSDLNADDGEAFGAAMWDEGEFIFSVSKEFVQNCQVPLLVLPGVDMAHPHNVGVEVAELAPNMECIDPWQDTPDRLAQTIDETRSFMQRHSAG